MNTLKINNLEFEYIPNTLQLINNKIKFVSVDYDFNFSEFEGMFNEIKIGRVHLTFMKLKERKGMPALIGAPIEYEFVKSNANDYLTGNRRII